MGLRKQFIKKMFFQLVPMMLVLIIIIIIIIKNKIIIITSENDCSVSQNIILLWKTKSTCECGSPKLFYISSAVKQKLILVN